MAKSNLDSIIENIKNQTGLDPNTLIFDPKKADDFIAKADKSRIAFLPVRPDWNEAKKVFGYYNPLTGLFYPTDGLNVLLNAFRSLMAGKKDKKHFIILDEMNLARVEYYFSDILSLMENMWKVNEKKENEKENKENKKAKNKENKEGEEKEIIRGETSQIHPFDRCILSKHLQIKKKKMKYINKPEKKCQEACSNYKDKPEKKCQKDCKKCYYGLLVGVEETKWRKDKLNEMDKLIKEFNPIPPRIAYPENLVIIGTVNVDETTFSFAPKVLDRAFQLEFTDVHYKEYLKSENIKVTKGPFYNFVDNLQQILSPKNMHFGYRVISEMLDFLKNTHEKENYEFLNEINDNKIKDDLDFLLKSKILPKLHGTEEQIGDILLQLLAFCKEGKKEDIPKENKDDWIKKLMEETSFIYTNSANKLKQMYQNMKATGYCSYF
ncbi:MAG: hypothetical protein ABIK61_06525 [candidate division WOR-3 bacterium]